MTACPVSNLFTVHGTSALHAPALIPFGTAIVTAYARLSRFTAFARRVRVVASHVSSTRSTAPWTTWRVVPITCGRAAAGRTATTSALRGSSVAAKERSEEHTSELQSRLHLVCRLLLEKKKKNQ